MIHSGITSTAREGNSATIMAKATAPAAPVQPIAVTPEPEAPTAPINPWDNLVAYPASAWATAPVQPTDTQKAVAAKLLADGALVVSTNGWSADTVGKFIKEVKTLKPLLDNRRIMFRTGEVDGKPAMLIKLGKAPAVTDVPA